jgi:hypothetical protein
MASMSIQVHGTRFGDGSDDGLRESSLSRSRLSAHSPNNNTNTSPSHRTRDRSPHSILDRSPLAVPVSPHGAESYSASRIVTIESRSVGHTRQRKSPSPSPVRVMPRGDSRSEIEMADVRGRSASRTTLAPTTHMTEVEDKESRRSSSRTRATAADDGLDLSQGSKKARSNRGGMQGIEVVRASPEHILESLHEDAGALCACSCQVLRSVSPWSAGSALEASIEQVHAHFTVFLNFGSFI